MSNSIFDIYFKVKDYCFLCQHLYKCKILMTFYFLATTILTSIDKRQNCEGSYSKKIWFRKYCFDMQSFQNRLLGQSDFSSYMKHTTKYRNILCSRKAIVCKFITPLSSKYYQIKWPYIAAFLPGHCSFLGRILRPFPENDKIGSKVWPTQCFTNWLQKMYTHKYTHKVNL